MINMKLTGFKELERNLKTLSDKVARKVLGNSVRAGANVVKRAAQANVPADSGNLRKFIKIQKRKSRVSGKCEYMVGPIWKKAFYGMFLEFGTKPHVIKPKSGDKLAWGGWVTGSARAGSKVFEGDSVVVSRVKHPGQPRRPWLRPAFDQNTDQVIEKMRVILKRGH